MMRLAYRFKKGRDAIRAASLAFGVCFAVACLLSSVFLWTHAGHEHDHSGPGDSCATCVQIAAAQTMLRQIRTAASIFVIFAIFAIPLQTAARFACPRIGSCTPVAMKVRLND